MFVEDHALAHAYGLVFEFQQHEDTSTPVIGIDGLVVQAALLIAAFVDVSPIAGLAPTPHGMSGPH